MKTAGRPPKYLTLEEKKQKIRESQTLYKKNNSAKVRAWGKAWNLQNPEKIRANHLRRFYGITSAQYNELLKNQNYSCAICPATTPSTRTKYFHVDHNHETQKIRGLLCDKCNRGLGMFNDDLVLLQKAMEYMKNHE